MANSQICLAPGITRNIRAYIQWARNLIRVGDNPENGYFNVNAARNLVRRFKIHEAFVIKSKTMTETSKPSKFTATTKWYE